MREFHLSDVGFELPHNKNVSSQVLLSSSRVLSLVLRWTLLHLLCSTSPPASAPFDEYFIEQKRQPSSCSPVLFSDSVRALGTYHLQMMTVSVCLGSGWRAYRIRRKRCVYSRTLYTVSFSPGIQGRPGFHSGCSCHGITTTTQ